MSHTSDGNFVPDQSAHSRDAMEKPPIVLAQIVLVPLADEEDDFETIITLGEVREQVLSEASTLSDYTTRLESGGTRDAGIILLLGTIAHQVIINKDLVIAMFQAGATAIGLLAKQRHVKTITITIDGDSITINEPDKATTQRLLESWEAKHPGTLASVTSSSSIQVTGTLSKA